LHVSDINRLRKLQTVLLLGASDMEQAAAAARALEAETEDMALMRALETAIAVCYMRAFTTSSLMTIPDTYLPTDPADAELHEFLQIRRNKAYAHTDKESGRSASTNRWEESDGTFTFEVREEWLPFPRDLIPALIDLCERQARSFRAGAGAIQVQLDAAADAS
jgi:hypothetical protein